jgi:SAM-dependent methyltransferase
MDQPRTRLAVVAGVAALGAGVALYVHRRRAVGFGSALWSPNAADAPAPPTAADAPAANDDDDSQAATTTTCTLEHSLALYYPTPEPPGTPPETPTGATTTTPSAGGATITAAGTAPPPPPPLPTLCARLCERHCAKLYDFNGEDGGEPLAIDAACGAGGAAFALADAGFSSVLGIDGDAAHVLAAKQLREQGTLEYSLLTAGGGGAAAPTTAVARVPEGVDRDRVRFWHCVSWPEALPPKLHCVDCVLVADAARRVPPGGVASLVGQAAKGLLAPGGVLVVLLGPQEQEEEGKDEQGAGDADKENQRRRLPAAEIAKADARWRSEVAPALAAALEEGEVELVAEHARLEYGLGTAAAAGGAGPMGVAGAAVYVRRRGGGVVATTATTTTRRGSG